MAEYIDRELIYKFLGMKHPNGFTNDDIADEFREAMPSLANLEVHARWVEYKRAHYFKCGNCKYTVPYRKAVLINGAREYNYCPHCGAKMDLTGDNA